MPTFDRCGGFFIHRTFLDHSHLQKLGTCLEMLSKNQNGKLKIEILTVAVDQKCERVNPGLKRVHRFRTCKQTLSLSVVEENAAAQF